MPPSPLSTGALLRQRGMIATVGEIRLTLLPLMLTHGTVITSPPWRVLSLDDERLPPPRVERSS